MISATTLCLPVREQQRPFFGLWWSEKGHGMLTLDTHWPLAAVIISANGFTDARIVAQVVTPRTVAVRRLRSGYRAHVVDFPKPTDDRTTPRNVL